MALYSETRRLQEERNAQFPGTDRTTPVSDIPFDFSRIPVTSSPYEGGDTPYTLDILRQPRSTKKRMGEYYDPTISYENMLANQQTGAERLAYFVPRVATKVASEIAQMPGYLGGAVAWAATGFDKDSIGFLVDNFWHKAIQGVEERVKEGLPVYTADAVKNGNLWANITSTAFWANEAADGLGFLLAFLAPGSAIRFTGFGAKMARLAKPGSKAVRALDSATTAEELAAAKKLLAATPFVHRVNDITATLINTLFESAAEAGETFNEIMQDSGDNEKAANAAVDVLTKNFGILGISNYIDQKWLFGSAKSIRNYSKLAAKGGLGKASSFRRVLDPASGELLDRVAKRSTWSSIGKVSKTLLEGTVKEGFWEEGMQYAVSKRAEEAESDDLTFLQELRDIAEVWWEGLGNDVDMHKSVFLGAIMGSGMAAVQTSRGMKAETRRLNNFHQIVKENHLSLYRDVSDFVKKQADGITPQYDENGKVIVDTEKLKEATAEQINKYMNNMKMIHHAENGNMEAFLDLKDQKMFDYFLPFLQMEGGLEAALHHLEDIAESEVGWLREEGVSLDMETVKREMKSDLIRYQQIYDRVEETHDLNMNIKYDKKDQQLFNDFSLRVRSAKLSVESILAHNLKRIAELRDGLSNYQKGDGSKVSFTSSENNLSENLGNSLREQVEAMKEELTPTELKDLQDTIKDIEARAENAKASRTRLSELYDKKKLQEEFLDYKQRKIESKTNEDGATSSALKDGEIAKAKGKLNSVLEDLYKKAVEFERLDNAQKDVIMHSAQLAQHLTDANGNKSTLTFEINGTTSTGNLSIRGLTHEYVDKDGNIVTEELGRAVGFLNADGSISLKGQTYAADGSPIIVKDAKTVQRDRKSEAVMNVIGSMLSEYQQVIKEATEDYERGVEYRERLMKAFNELAAKERASLEKYGTILTRKGTSRVQMVKLFRERGKNIQKMYLTASEIQDEINKTDRHLNAITNKITSLQERHESARKMAEELKLSSDIRESLEQSIDSLLTLHKDTSDLLTSLEEEHANSKLYLKRLHSTLKGFHTRAARLLGLEDQINDIRNDHTIPLEERENLITNLIIDSFEAIEKDAKVAAKTIFQPIRGAEFLGEVEHYDVFYEELGTLLDTVESIHDKIDALTDNLSDLEHQIEMRAAIKEGIRRKGFNARRVLNRSNLEYYNLAQRLGIIQESAAQTKLAAKATPEDLMTDIEKIESRDYQLQFEGELDSKHVFSMTAGLDNFLYSTGDQRQAESNDDLARWYHFVKNFAYKFNSKTGLNNYVIRTVSLRQVGQLEQDHPMRQQLRFWDGSSLKTYDQLENKENAIANDDIKIVAFTRGGNMVRVTDNGQLDSKGDKIIWNSLPDATDKTAGGFERFTFQRAVNSLLNKKGKNLNTASIEEREAAEKEVKDQLDKDKAEYANLKEELKTKSAVLEIATINPGVKQMDGADSAGVLEGTGRKHPNELRGNIRTVKSSNYGGRTEVSTRGAKHSLRNGFWYVMTGNRFELIKPKTLAETGSVDEVLALIRHYAADPANEMLEKYLHDILWTGINDTTGQVSPFKLIFSKVRDYTAKPKPHTVSRLFYGNLEITRDQLINGENLEPLRDFLGKKYWNFKNDNIGKTEFTELKVDKKGKLVSKVWSSEQGGYLGFLFSTSLGNKPKGDIHVRKNIANGVEAARPGNTQYLNQSLQLSTKKASARTNDKVDSAPPSQNSGYSKPQAGQTITTDEGKTATLGMRRLGGHPAASTPTAPKSSEAAPAGIGMRRVGGGTAAPVAIKGAFSPKDSSTPTGVTNPAPLGTPTNYAETFGTPTDTVIDETVKEATAQELGKHWESVSQADKDMYNEATNGNEELAMRLAWSADQQAKSGNIGMKRRVDRKARQIDNYRLENTEVMKAWLKEKFPNLPVEIVDKIDDGGVWGRVTHDARILISAIAEEGTGYHEAWHAYSLLVLNETDRGFLYDETRARLNRPDMTNKEAEEHLAEEFRSYMLAPNAYQFGKDESHKKNLFEIILDFILSIFGIERTANKDFRIEQNFKTLKEGVFNVGQKALPESYDRRTVGEMTDKDIHLAITDINAVFFDKLFDRDNPFALDGLIGNIDQTLENIYKLVYLQYRAEVKYAGPDDLRHLIVENFENKKADNDLKREHLRYLSMYKINPNAVRRAVLDSLEEGNEYDDRPSNEYRDSLSINVSDIAPEEIRLVIASLPLITTGDRITNDIKAANVRSTANYKRIYDILKSEMAGLGNDYMEYAAKMLELGEIHDEFNVLYERLGGDTPVVGTGMFMLRNQFVAAFGNTENRPLITEERREGVRKISDERDNNILKSIINAWKNSAVDLVKNPDSYIKKSADNKFIVDTQRLLTDIQNSLQFYEGSPDRLQAQLDILDRLGMTISPNRSKVVMYKPIDDYITRLAEQIRRNKGKELIVTDLYNSDVIKNQKETAAIVEYAKRFMYNDRDLSYRNQSGSLEYSIILNSNVTDVINALERIRRDDKGELVIPESIGHLRPFENGEGNLFTRNSRFFRHKLHGGSIVTVDLKGSKSSRSHKNGVEISKATPGDYKAITINALLMGRFPMLRSADRKRELAFELKDNEGAPIAPEYNLTREMVHTMLTEYLTDELATSFALLIDPDNFGGELGNYSKHARDLRSFDFIYEFARIPSLEEFVGADTVVKNEDTIARVDRLVGQYLSDYKVGLAKAFDGYMDKLRDLTIESFKQDGMIEERTFKSSPPIYFIRGIDMDTLRDKFNITPITFNGAITQAQLHRIIDFANYRQFIGAQEQIKLIMGDLAMWADPIDFHKRVNGSTSPKLKMADSEAQRTNMNELYRRVDGKVRDQYVKKVVVDELVSRNKELSKIYPEYGHIEGADAATMATLDEIRDFHIKSGIWTHNHERAYQWEMQSLVLKLLELGKDNPYAFKASESMFTDLTGIFYEHTRGVLPKKPMYFGSEIKIDQVGAITQIKPVGFGNIDNIPTLNVPSYWKTAISPMFPSSYEVGSKMFNVLMAMMANQQGMLVVRSAEKGEVVNSQPMFTSKGEVPKSGYRDQLMKYSDFGRQLDIDDVEKDRVRRSRQRTMLEFSDLYDTGQFRLAPDETFLEYENLRKEYVDLLSSIVEEERSRIIKNLGLELDPDRPGYYKLLPGKSKETFKKELLKAFGYRTLPKNMEDGLELAIDAKDPGFDMTVSKFKVEEILTAMVRENAIGLYSKGDMLIQESNHLFDNTLKFYRKAKNERGDDIILPMEVMVSLPNNLIPLALKLGKGDYTKGLARINRAIDTYNKISYGEEVSQKDKDSYMKGLGEDFFKILDIPMNRIPGQTISSLDAGRVAKFLPHYHGPKVVLPVEIVTKTGSDFDVDKMTSYLSNFKLDDNGRVVYNRDLNTRGGKENRLNEIANQLLLAPERFEELIKPLASSDLKGLVNAAVAKIPKTKLSDAQNENNWNKTTTWWYNMQKGVEFFRAKAGTAVAAVQNTAHAYSQIKPVRMTAYVPMFFEGQQIDLGGKYINGHIKDTSNRNVSNNIAQFLSAFVDVVRDPFVYQITDGFTFNTIAFLNRYGTTESVGLDSIVNFMTQDAIQIYDNIQRKYSPRFWRDSYYDHKDRRDKAPKKLYFYEQINATIDQIRRDYGKIEGSAIKNYEDTLAYELDMLLKGLKKEPDALKAIEDKIKKYNYKYFTLDQLSGEDIRKSAKDQLQILDNYLVYQIMGRNLVNLNNLLRPDAKSNMGRTITQIKANQYRSKGRVEVSPLFNWGDVLDAMGTEESPEILSEFFKTRSEVEKMFGWTSLIHKDPIVSEFFESIIYPSFSDYTKWNRSADIDRNLTEAESHFLVFLMSNAMSITGVNELRDVYKYLFKGESSVPRQLQNIKLFAKHNINNPNPQTAGLARMLSTNSAIEALESVISRRINPQRTLAEIDNISTFGRSYNNNEIDNIESDLYELSHHADLEQFVMEMAYHSLFQSGIHTSVNSYLEVIPNRIFVNMATNALDAFSALSDETKESMLFSFLDQFYRNNAHNANIVKRGGYTMTAPKSRYGFRRSFEDGDNKTNTLYHAGENYVAFNYFTHDPVKFIREGTMPPMDVVLYKRTPGTDEFVAISKLGDGNRMKEYYPMATGYNEIEGFSLFEANTYEQRAIDVTFDEVFEDSLHQTDYEGPDAWDYHNEMPYPSSSTAIPPNIPITKQRRMPYVDAGARMMVSEGHRSYYTQILGENVDVPTARVLSLIERNSSNEDYRFLAKVLRSKLKTDKYPPLTRINGKFVEEAQGIDKETGLPNAAAFYNYTNYKHKFIAIHDRLTTENFEETMLHEALHNLTYEALRYDTEFANRIKKLADRAYNHYYNMNREFNQFANEYYGVFQDVDEFISYALTDRIFQRFLSAVPSEIQDPGSSETRSALGEFIDMIFDALRKLIMSDRYIAARASDPNFVNRELHRLDKTRSVLTDLLTEVDTYFTKDLTLEDGSLVKNLAPVEAETQFEVREVPITTKEANTTELTKEANRDFSALFPYYDYLDSTQRDAFMEVVNKGLVEIACGL